MCYIPPVGKQRPDQANSGEPGAGPLSEELCSELVDRLPDSITITDLEGKIIKTNRHGAALFGADDEAELIGKNAFELIAPEDRERAAKNLERTLVDGWLEHVEYRMLRKDGSTYPAELSASVIPGPDGQPLAFVATVRDVTRRKQMEARLTQADRLANLGVLAAGVAHEVNNPLTYLLLNMTRVAEDLPRIAEAADRCRAERACSNGDGQASCQAKPPCDYERLNDLAKLARLAAEGGQQVKKIVNDLRTFSRTDEDKRIMVQLNDIVDNAANIAVAEAGEQIRIDKDYGDLPLIPGNEGRLGQVFLNLLLNAVYAVAEGKGTTGRIDLRTLAEGDHVTFEVSDSGAGIEPECIDRIFEPFFTTKPTGVGTGMGLTICQSIVHSHGGTIEVTSTFGKGSRFVVRLPVSEIA
jgi:PAS domain S-box-containing protein